MNKKISIVLIGFLVVIAACKKTANPNSENEHEAINKVEIRFSRAGTLVQTAVIEDLDGDGGNPPSRIDTIRLAPSQTYTAAVSIKNVVNGVEKDLSSKIAQQGRSHEFFFLPTGVSATITKTDLDALGFPIGFNSNWAVGAAASGSIQFKLMHKPGIKGPADGPNVGHSDIDVRLHIILQ
jgi:hypothetical protein